MIFCSQNATQLSGKRVVLFSYGSGLASTMFTLRASQNAAPGSALDKMASGLSDLKERLDSRKQMPPQEFADCMKLREDTHHLGEYL